jgi:hypothetical protein
VGPSFPPPAPAPAAPDFGMKVFRVLGFIVMVIVIAAIKIGCRQMLR